MYELPWPSVLLEARRLTLLGVLGQALDRARREALEAGCLVRVLHHLAPSCANARRALLLRMWGSLASAAATSTVLSPSITMICPGFHGCHVVYQTKAVRTFTSLPSCTCSGRVLAHSPMLLHIFVSWCSVQRNTQASFFVALPAACQILVPDDFSFRHVHTVEQRQIMKEEAAMRPVSSCRV